MFGLFKKKKPYKEQTYKVEDKILMCARRIVEKGSIKEDNTHNRNIPSVTLQDDKGNTLYVSWYSSSTSSAFEVKINNNPVPVEYDNTILKLVQKRVQVLQKEYLEKVIDSMVD